MWTGTLAGIKLHARRRDIWVNMYPILDIAGYPAKTAASSARARTERAALVETVKKGTFEGGRGGKTSLWIFPFQQLS